MKHRIVLLPLLFLALPNWCFALIPIENVTPERAKALGLEIRSNAAGPDAVRVELAFEIKGELQEFSRVDLIMESEGKLLLHSTLQPESSQSGHVVVGFAADRSCLDKLTLRVVTQSSERSRVGHDLQVSKFVDLPQPDQKAEEPILPVSLSISELKPEHDGQEVEMTFTVKEAHGISGSVPVGQVPSFGITPVRDDSDPRFSVLVCGDVADLMERFGIFSPALPLSNGITIRATGKLTVFPPPADHPDKVVSYQLAIRDWRGFRVLPKNTP